eukprot:COSAG01_NODE_7903_length_2999_cov_3.954483_4_plen_147_part_00
MCIKYGALTGQGRADGILARAPRDGRHVEADLLCGTGHAATVSELVSVLVSVTGCVLNGVLGGVRGRTGEMEARPDLALALQRCQLGALLLRNLGLLEVREHVGHHVRLVGACAGGGGPSAMAPQPPMRAGPYHDQNQPGFKRIER